MRTSLSAKRAGIAEWTAQSVRLTTFHPQGSPMPQGGQWKQFFGEEPNSIVDKPREGIRAEVGLFNGSQVVYNSQILQNRVDWLLMDHPEQTPDEPISKKLDIRLDLFKAPTSEWLKCLEYSVIRLAFGVSIILPVPTREAGYELLSNYLNFDLDPITSSDFTYQINKRRKSKLVDNLEINRLSKWNCAAYTLHRLVINPHATSHIQSTSMAPIEHACSLELDISTAQENTNIFNRDIVVSLYHELIEIGMEIVRDGDIQ